MKVKLTKKAFSLIELSIVILIIGIIVAGVTQSNRLIGAFRMAMARSLTDSSPVPSMKNIILWLDATSEESFLQDEDENDAKVSLWKDINPAASIKYGAWQDDENLRPVYKKNCINNLPCINFAGANYFDFEGGALVASNYTIFVVEQRRSGADNNFFIAGGAASTNGNLMLGYLFNGVVTFSQYGNDYDYLDIGTYTSPVARIHTFLLNSNVGRSYYINGQSMALTESIYTGYHNATDQLISFDQPHIGRDYDDSYQGDIAEIIIIANALDSEDRKSIEAYLGKKWRITTTL